MAIFNGTNATVKINNTTIANLAAWSFEDKRPTIKAKVFGDTNTKIVGTDVREVVGKIEGFLDKADTNGQTVLNTAYTAGTTVSGFKLCVDATHYYECDIVTDANAGVYLSSNTVSAKMAEVIPVSFDFEVSGAWHYV